MYGIENKKAIYFGDATNDYEAAKDNKIDFVGVVNEKSKELRGLFEVMTIKDFGFSNSLNITH
ncbi:MAG: hypothetical protein SCARUB_01126 [Candidatus Scalindua rubra]|uniref:Uncharacterized protein n=1 Tax=Candidatus Scalindua rubra TaxID=1872076 RepID=A0A1E3XDU4_9BACT|nr:MAG: hypothetical protein SCARUB_01126 [Candidatus Scalindua rubra]